MPVGSRRATLGWVEAFTRRDATNVFIQNSYRFLLPSVWGLGRLKGRTVLVSVSPKASRMKVTRGECEPAFHQNALSSLLAYLIGLRDGRAGRASFPTQQAQLSETKQASPAIPSPEDKNRFTCI